MSDQPQQHSRKKRTVRVRRSLQMPRGSATAALSHPARGDSADRATPVLAVGSAGMAPGSREEIAPAAGQATVPAGRATVPAAVNGNRLTRPAAAAAAILLAVTGGWFGAQALSNPSPEHPWSETATALRQSREDVVRLGEDVKALKAALDILKDGIDRARTDAVAKQAQLVERLERSDRMPQETSTRIAQLGAQLDRIETAAKDPGAKLAALGERLDRIERQIAAVKPAAAPATGPVAAASAAVAPGPAVPDATGQTGSPDPRLKETPVEGWVLHEVQGGVALIESRNRRLFEVGPGEVIPGVGRVETIEKRGKRWVVVTAKGIISTVR